MPNRAQQVFGEPAPSILRKVRPEMDAVVQEFIRSAPFAVMATSNADGDCDASPKGGRPGFIRVIDQRTLLLPDLPGNKLFQSYENIESNPKVGLIFMIPGCNVTVRVNGRATVVDGVTLAADGIAAPVFDPDGRTTVQQALRIEIDEAYPHCPRSLRFARLWQTAADDAGDDAGNEKRSDRYWYRQWANAAE